MGQRSCCCTLGRWSWVELRSVPEELPGGRPRLARVHPWTDLVARAADSLDLRESRGHHGGSAEEEEEKEEAGHRSWRPCEAETLRVLERAEPRIRALAASPEDFLELCRPLQSSPGGTTDSSAQGFGASGDGAAAANAGAAMVPSTWAAALVEQLPALKDTRYRLVPRRLSEEVFWSRYFVAVFRILTEELRAAASGDVPPPPPPPPPLPPASNEAEEEEVAIDPYSEGWCVVDASG